MTANTDVVVIGGGYAGVIAANHLRVRDDVRITLINPRSSFVERIRLRQLVTGSDDAVVEYETVLGAGVRLIVDEASAIDPAQRSVALASGGAVGYDHLVYAVGSRSATPAVPGAAEFAHPVAELEHAERLRDALSDADPGPATTTPSDSRRCGRCCSPSPTRSSGPRPRPTMCCRTATCGGPRWTWRPCGTPSRTWPRSSPGRR